MSDANKTKVFDLPGGHEAIADREKRSITIDLKNGASLELTYSDDLKPTTAAGRHCGSCQLCCRVLPVPEIDKPAWMRCGFSRKRNKGCCSVYEGAQFPSSCQGWSCRWLVDGNAAFGRPDRVHYVVDVLPDFIVMKRQEMEDQQIPALQIWVDPDYPDAHRDRRLRAFIETNAQQTGQVAIIRRGPGHPHLIIVAPAMSETGQWREIPSQLGEGVGLWNQLGQHKEVIRD